MIEEMKYHVYRFGNGCKWMDDFQEAVDYFKGLPTDGKYASIGITEGSYAVDIVIKGQYAEGQNFLVSQDIKQSALFKENPEKMLKALEQLYRAVGVNEDVAKRIITDLKQMADSLDDSEEM